MPILLRFLAVFAILVGAGACARGDVRDEARAIPESVRSAASYDANESGVVTASRLRAWIEDWEGQRPAGIHGDLVILQLDPGPSPAVIASAPGVRAYLAPELRALVVNRSNGLVALGSAPADGIRIDSFLRHFRIRPSQDLVVFARGSGSLDSLADLTRAFLVFRYWGFEHRSLALLDLGDGDFDSEIAASFRTDTPSTHPFDGTERVVGNAVDRFELLADLEVVRASLDRSDVVVVDARGPDEFEGRTSGETEVDDSCLAGAPSCLPSVSGRIAGAVSLPATTLLHDGRFLEPAAIDTAIAAIVPAGRTAITYDLDGRESAILAFALHAIAGRPVRWYAASYLEWGSLNATHPTPALRALAADHPLRTDHFPTLIDGATTWAPDERGVRPLVLDPSVRRTDRIQATDRAYRASPPPLPGVGVGDGGC